MILQRLAGNPKQLLRFISAFASRFGSTILSFAVLFVASKLLPTLEYGLYIFLFSVGSALGLMAVFGQQILVVKHYRRDGDNSVNAELVRVNIGWLLLGACLLLCSAIALWFARPYLDSPYDSLSVACLFGVVFAFSEYFQNYFRIHGRISLSLLPREIVWRAGSTVTMLVVAAFGLLYSGVEAMLIVTGILIAVTGYQLIAFMRMEAATFGNKGPSRWRRWGSESLYFIANNILNASSAYLETIAIGAFLGLDKAAFYFVALRIAMLLTLPVTAIDTVGIPLIAARFQNKDTAGAQRLIARLSLASFVISLAGALMIGLVGRYILALFNAEFATHFDVLLILCASAVSQSFFGPGSWLLMIGGGERFFLIARAVLFVVYLGLLYLFASTAGLAGVAIASMLFALSSNLAAAVWIMQHWGIDNMATAFFKPLVLKRKSDPRDNRPHPITGSAQVDVHT